MPLPPLLIALVILSNPQASPEQQSLADIIRNAKPGTVVEYEVTSADQGATGTGASISTNAEKVMQDFNNTAPEAALPGKATATGGDLTSHLKLEGEAKKGMAIALLAVGVLCWLGAGFAFYRMSIRGGLVLLAMGAAFMACALWPALIWIIALGGLAALIGPYLWAELKAKGGLEALRASLAAVADMSPAAQAEYHRAFVSHASDQDHKTARSVRGKDNLVSPAVVASLAAVPGAPSP